MRRDTTNFQATLLDNLIDLQEEVSDISPGLKPTESAYKMGRVEVKLEYIINMLAADIKARESEPDWLKTIETTVTDEAD